MFIKREFRFESVIFADESEGGVPGPAARIPGKRGPGRPRVAGRKVKKTGNLIFF